MNVPNALSIFRIFLIPVFVFAYVSENSRLWAAAVYATAFVTDILDGWIARRFHQITRLGRVLDPLADKLMTLAAILCVCVDGVIPMWAAAAFFAKELAMGLGGIALFRRARDVISANWLGKLSTGVFFAVLLALILFPDIPRGTASRLISLALALAFAALIGYMLAYRETVACLPEEK